MLQGRVQAPLVLLALVQMIVVAMVVQADQQVLKQESQETQEPMVMLEPQVTPEPQVGGSGGPGTPGNSGGAGNPGNSGTSGAASDFLKQQNNYAITVGSGSVAGTTTISWPPQ